MLVLQAQLTRFNTMADGGGRLQLDTQELTPEQFSEIGTVNKKFGVLVFKPDVEEITEKEKQAIEQTTITKIPTSKRSKSQIFRFVLSNLYDQDPEGFKTKEDHYNHYMDQIINHFKGKLKENG